ncbi:sulfatase-like hydrolase/transferase [Natronorubrum aibiense]|uniref:Sulfatase-like hydrolase/transferase n=1 Tax=Natronorubrum aibiense TaxID=348826 RepID=A0A5P9P2V5_9EURY|nr:sulfatase-like hydrolase/transferase [Natronorubrum aibiense]QFU82471.1 sulfatase-like hydrolase/transferase [Natronorubrum aibiense]
MADADTQRPNILFVLTDQERYDCTAPDGPPVETKAMDTLSEDGVRFTHAFTPISICTSARASLLTGRYPHSHGMLNNSHEADSIQPNLPDGIPTFSEILAENGYMLSYIGKWHVGNDQTPEDFGFSYLGGSDRHHDDIDEAFREYRRKRGVPVEDVDLEEEIYTHGDPRDDSQGTLVAAKAPIDVEDTRAWFIAERTIEAIEEYATGQRDKPFFHRTDFYGPHHPYVVPDDAPDPDEVCRPDPDPYASMYDPNNIKRLKNYNESYENKPSVQKSYLFYRGVAEFDWDLWAEAIAKYRAFVTLIDDQLGRIRKALEEHGLHETIVVHASDHGDFAGGHRQFNKGPLMYDDTYRIPLQVYWPKYMDKEGETNSGTCVETEQEERTIDKPVHLHDLTATFLEMAEIDEIPEKFEAQEYGKFTSRSLVPFLKRKRKSPKDINITNGNVGKSNFWPSSIFAQYHGDEFGLYTQRMVRTDRYKYIYNGPDIDELYDLEADPSELTNLIDDSEYVETRQDMRRRLIHWMNRTKDPNRKWVPDVLRAANED